MNDKQGFGVAPSAVGLVAFVSAATAAAYVLSNPNNNMTGNKKRDDGIPKIFQDEILGPKVKKIIAKYVDRFTCGESLIKIVRQLDFWYSEQLDETQLLEMTENLSEKATVLTPSSSSSDHSDNTHNFQCPKVRFGKTELRMPIVTCGGMRLQQTWMPDFLWPLSPNRRGVLKSRSQDNLVRALRLCVRAGINHFETARFYGTSEYQFADALRTLIRSGEMARDGVIFQTKVPPQATRGEFEKLFLRSWEICGPKLGYIDLLSFWCVSSEEQTKWLLADGDDTCMAAALEYKKRGWIRHIGFSTHGTAGHILELINSDKFEYVNIHDHFLGSYHAEGTMDGQGGHGNHHAVKRALELDMGVFLISPIDKGGAMYRPSKTLARTLGPTITPIEFAMLSAWKTLGHHTASVGFARPADIEDAIVAARMFTQADSTALLKSAEERMNGQMEKELGREWKEKGLLNLPTCEEESTHGTAIGHVLWLYGLLKSFGMYDFCADRYKSLLSCPWNAKKPFDENLKKMSPGNMGRAFIPGLDYSKALESHYDAQAAISNMEQVHEWMKIGKDDVETRKAKGFDEAYDLRVWEAFPGDAPDLKGVVLQNLTYGMLGCGGGPTKSSADLAARLVEEVKNSSSL